MGAYVYSSGYGLEVTIARVYVNGTLDVEAIVHESGIPLYSITLSNSETCEGKCLN